MPKSTSPATPEVAATPVHVDFFLNGKAVGPSMNRLERVATFYAHHVREKVTIEGIDKTGPVWLKVNEFKVLLRHMGVEVPITKDFDLTLPNGKMLSGRVAGSKSPVPQPVKAEKVAKATKKATPPVTAAKAEATKAERAAKLTGATSPASAALAVITGDAAAHVSSLSRVRQANDATKRGTRRLDRQAATRDAKAETKKATGSEG